VLVNNSKADADYQLQDSPLRENKPDKIIRNDIMATIDMNYDNIADL
jgi:hypothetical protein